MAGLGDIIAACKPAAKPGEGPKVQRKYVQFTMEEWSSMEASAGAKLETSDVKAIVQGIFTGKVSINVAKK